MSVPPQGDRSNRICELIRSRRASSKKRRHVLFRQANTETKVYLPLNGTQQLNHDQQWRSCGRDLRWKGVDAPAYDVPQTFDDAAVPERDVGVAAVGEDVVQPGNGAFEPGGHYGRAARAASHGRSFATRRGRPAQAKCLNEPRGG